MRKIIMILSISVMFLACSTTNNRNDIVLSNKGNTKYHIIVSSKATDNEIYAAKILQEYIHKISGAKIPIVNKCKNTHKEEIHIGNWAKCKGNITPIDGFMVQRKGSTLYFKGKDDIHTMYSVIDFMENYLGVRRFTADQDYFPIDSCLTLKNFNTYTYKPINVYRNVNSKFIRQNKDLKRWFRANTNDDMFANGYFVHTILDLCSPKELFDSHPEYFALVNGERSREQICWTNEDVFNIVKKNLSRAMIIQPDKNIWSVSQADNDIVCQCEKCKKLIDRHQSAGAPVIYFVNKIAREFPYKTISTLAYRFSRQCPINMTVEDNVQIMLCSIEVDRNKTIEEQGKSYGSFAYDMTQWSKITKNIFLWDYECNFDYYLSPFPNLHVLQPNIQFFVNNNAFQHFQQANCDVGHEFSELKNYLLAQLLWNPNIDVDLTITEFCNNYYGRAGHIIKSYIDDIEKKAIKLKDTLILDIYGSPVKMKDNLLSKDNLLKWSQMFDTAENEVRDDSICLLRVRTARLPLQYAIMEIAKTNMYSPNGWFEMVDNKWIVRKEMRHMLEEFHDVCNQIEMVDINEKGLTPEEYYQTTKRMIDNNLSDNLAFHKKVTANISPSLLYSNGDINTLTDGVLGSDDYKMLWIGWWGEDVSLSVDLEQITNNKTISLSSLNKPASWILHPLSVECKVSKDNKRWESLGEVQGFVNNRYNTVTKDFKFFCNKEFRYIKLIVHGTKTLPSWHHCYTQKSWVFLDEIVVN